MANVSKKDVSIEYAHIYTNNKISEEQKLSLDILTGIKKDLESKNKTFALVVLVDDYSFPDPSFDYNKFNSWLKSEGFGPDVVFRESQLIPLCDEVLNNIKDEKLKEKLIDYVKAKKYPCSLFITAWYLLRLGYLEYPSFDKKYYAKSLINILPQSFKPFEDEVLKIIAASEFGGAEKLIDYHFIEGRLIA